MPAENSNKQPPRRVRGRPFPKGVSGNAGGRPREVGHVRELAKQHTEEAIETLVVIMRDASQPGRARSAAAESLLNRAWGAPTQHMEMDARVEDLTPYTDEELLARWQYHVDDKRKREKGVH